MGNKLATVRGKKVKAEHARDGCWLLHPWVPCGKFLPRQTALLYIRSLNYTGKIVYGGVVWKGEGGYEPDIKVNLKSVVRCRWELALGS